MNVLSRKDLFRVSYASPTRTSPFISRRPVRFPQVYATSGTSRIETPPDLRIAPWANTPAQQNALKELNQRLGRTPHAWDDETVKWFLRDRNYDPIEAEEKLLKTAQWRKDIQFDHLSPEQFSKEFSSGKVRLHDHLDVLGRPVIVLDASKHRIGQYPVISTQKLCAYVVKEALQKMPSDVDTFLAIFDLRNFQASNADLGFMKYVIDLFFVYNPKRMGQTLMVDAPWVFQPVWQVIKPLLKKYSALVRFVETEQVQREYFTTETVPKEFLL